MTEKRDTPTRGGRATSGMSFQKMQLVIVMWPSEAKYIPPPRTLAVFPLNEQLTIVQLKQYSQNMPPPTPPATLPFMRQFTREDALSL